MSERLTIPLRPMPIELGGPEYQTLSDWPFNDSFVARMLRDDLPERVLTHRTRIWGYYNPDDQLVGFATLDVCDEYQAYTGGSSHPYIPLLAVNPAFERLGHGNSIVRHLIGEAAVLIGTGGCARDIYLDVYETSIGAIRLYEKAGFIKVTDDLFSDPCESGLLYQVMARRVTVVSLDLKLSWSVNGSAPFVEP